MRGYFWDLVFQRLIKKMCHEDFLVEFIRLLCFAVERPKETLIILHDMGGPLWIFLGEGCVTNEIFVFVLSRERRDL